jgi:exodeoxyribonuclease V gamma subunit
MIRLCTSNAVEALAEALADRVAATRTSLFEPVEVVVPNGLVETFVKQRLAHRLGVAANVRAGRLRGFLRDVARASAPEARIIDRDAIEGELLALLHDPRRVSLAALEPARAYVEAAGDDPPGRDRRRVQLAAKLADLFEEYAYSRPALLAAWRTGRLAPGLDDDLQRWQREAWLALFGQGGPLAGPNALTLPDFFTGVSAEALRAPPVHVFGISYVARLYRSIFASLARASAVHVYALNPCREFWEDVEPARRGRRAATGRRRAQQLTLALDGSAQDGPPSAPLPAPAEENPLLARWARPGRDNVRLLNQLADFDFEPRFVDPTEARPTLLATLQREVLDRRAPGDRPRADDSVVILPAADPRRELETLAAEIWSMIRRDEARERRGDPGRPLRFSDFAVIVPPASAARYLPLARSVFHEASGLPHTIVDLPPAGEGRIAEAVELLLALPASNLARPDLLRLAMHPAVARRFPDVDPEDWLALADELPIVSGADAADHAGSYLEQDRVSWDQGLRRLALGAFLSGRPSGEERPFVRPFVAGAGPELPAELAAGGEPAARALGVLARELLAFVAAARSGSATIETWLGLIRRTLAATIDPATPEEEGAMGDAFSALERVGESAPAGLVTTFLVAAELVRARLARRDAPGHRAPEGVTVASFVPMRALPFRVVMVAGLDERIFPSTEGLHALDLRASGPAEEGDVGPRERDEYMFLETLLSARERLVLSYVARDARTGEEKDPSSILLTLRDYLGTELAEAVTRRRPPLLRHEDEAAAAVIPAATRERRAAALGASLRRAAGVVELPPPGELAPMLAAEVRPALARLFHWPADRATARPAAAGPPRRRSLTLADLRRFLECPLQGSVGVLLPLGAEEDAADDAEAAALAHENLDEVRTETVPLLREALARALADGGTDAALASAYDGAADIRRLDGVLPSGIFGRSARVRHLALLAAWRDGLDEALGASFPTPVAPLWLGGGPEHRRDLALHPAIALEVALPDGPAIIELGGVTEPLAELTSGRVSVSLIASPRPPAYIERELLRPWLTQVALAAAGIAVGDLGALLIRPAEGGGGQVATRVLPAISTDDARAYLAALAGELLGAMHDYLLPCEGVFTWRRRQDKGMDIGVRDAVLLLRDDGWTRLSSDRGPVSDARRYPVPPEAQAAAIVARRFDPYFEATPLNKKGGRR